MDAVSNIGIGVQHRSVSRTGDSLKMLLFCEFYLKLQMDETSVDLDGVQHYCAERSPPINLLACQLLGLDMTAGEDISLLVAKQRVNNNSSLAKFILTHSVFNEYPKIYADIWEASPDFMIKIQKILQNYIEQPKPGFFSFDKFRYRKEVSALQTRLLKLNNPSPTELFLSLNYYLIDFFERHSIRNRATYKEDPFLLCMAFSIKKLLEHVLALREQLKEEEKSEAHETIERKSKP